MKYRRRNFIVAWNDCTQKAGTSVQTLHAFGGGGDGGRGENTESAIRSNCSVQLWSCPLLVRTEHQEWRKTPLVQVEGNDEYSTIRNGYKQFHNTRLSTVLTTFVINSLILVGSSLLTSKSTVTGHDPMPVLSTFCPHTQQLKTRFNTIIN
jgi:hypothetical protein